MSENRPLAENECSPHQPVKRGWGRAQWFVVGLLALLSVGVAVPWWRGVNEKANQMWAMSNCRQIAVCLKSYAGDHGGHYPDGLTSNDAFRELMKEGLLDTEIVFSAPNSPYVGDEKLGTAPEYSLALQPGENHWAMTKGLTDDSPGNSPLLFENPALVSWPPKWDSRLVDVAKPGRVWKGGRIVVCRNDCSACLEKLAEVGKPLVTLVKNSEGKDLFDLAGPHIVLDVAK